MGYLQRVGEGVARLSQRFGDPEGTFSVVVPATVTTPNSNLFHKVKAGGDTTTTYSGCRGGWATQQDQNEEGIGRVEKRVGSAVLFHAKHDTTDADIRELIASEGAQLYWTDAGGKTRISLDAVEYDDYQGATVITFHRDEVT